MKLARIFLILSPVVLLLLLEAILLWPPLLFWWELLAVLWIVFVVRFWSLKSSLGKKWFFHAFLPLLFFLSLSLGTTILINHWLIQFIFLFVAIFLTRYFAMLYNFWVKNDLKQIDRLPNFSLSAGLLIIFFSVFYIFSLQVFINWSLGRLFLLSAVTAILVIYHNWRSCQLNFRVNFLAFLTAGLLLSEVLLILLFWPFSYHFLALIAVLSYYLLINYFRLSLGAEMEKGKLKFYFIFSALAFLILILSTRWL